MANGLALEAALAARPGRAHVISQRSEHSSLLRALAALEERGCALSWLDLDREGRVDPAQLGALIRPGETALVSVMAANHETGALQPLAGLRERCREAGVLLHTDATQGLRALAPLSPLPADLISFAGHKHGGPRGVGGLVLAPGLAPPRTWPASPPHVDALATALEASRGALAGLAAARDELERALLAAIPGAVRSGPARARLPGHLSLLVPDLSADALLLELDLAGLALSSGAACSSGEGGPSHVLLAMGLDPAAASGALRFSLGAPLEPAERARVVEALRAGVARLRTIAGDTGAAESPRS